MKINDFRKMTVGDFMDLIILITKDNSEKMQNNNQLVADKVKKELSNQEILRLKLALSEKNAEILKENNLLIELFNKILDFQKGMWKTIEYIVKSPEKNVENVNIGTKKDSKKGNDINSIEIAELNQKLNELINEERYEECNEIQQIINKKTKTKFSLKLKI